jgi:integrase
VSGLRQHRRDTEWPGDEDLLFPSLTGTPIQPNNLRRRTLRPLVEEVEAAWAGFHTFRHTCASLLFERGANAKQVQRWLGHHSPSFTLDTYIHLLPDQLDAPLELDAELRTRGVGTPWEQDPAEAHRNGVRRNPPIPLQKSRSPTETNCD